MGRQAVAGRTSDILVAEPSGATVLVVEVKNRRGLDAEAARQHLALIDPPHLCYFMLVSQETAHVWSPGEARGLQPPSASFAFDEVVAQYAPEASDDDRLHGQALELIVVEWLAAVCAGRTEPAPAVREALSAIGLTTELLAGCAVDLPQ